jgi:hypothetical protein
VNRIKLEISPPQGYIKNKQATRETFPGMVHSWPQMMKPVI